MARKSGTKGARQRTGSQRQGQRQQRQRSQRQGQRQRQQRQRSQRQQRTRQGSNQKRRTQKRSLNPFMQKLNAARTSGAQSFQYNGNSYNRRELKTGMIVFKKSA